MFIGNVIYENDLVNHDKVEYINYFHKNNLDDNINYDLPTLYVGWKLVKEYVKDVNILKNIIEPNKLYWTFSFDEEKAAHVKGVERFVDNVPYYYFNSRYQYINLDPVFHNIPNIEGLFNIISENIIKTYVLKNRMLYVLSTDNKIYGLDLEMFNFFNFDTKNIKNTLKEKSTSFFEDIDGEKHQTFYKIFPNFTFLKRYLVVLF